MPPLRSIVRIMLQQWDASLLLLAGVGLLILSCLGGCSINPKVPVGNKGFQAPGSIVISRSFTDVGGKEWWDSYSLVPPQGAKDGSGFQVTLAPLVPNRGADTTGDDGAHTPSDTGGAFQQAVAIVATMGASYEPPEPERDVTFEQWLFYGGAGVLLAAGTLLLIFGKHFKLCAIFWGVGLIWASLGVAVIEYPFYLCAGIGTVVVGLATTYGWYLWVEYKKTSLTDASPQTPS